MLSAEALCMEVSRELMEAMAVIEMQDGESLGKSLGHHLLISSLNIFTSSVGCCASAVL